MSNANQETIADIVAAMRNEGHAGDESCLEWVGAKIRGYADRIEAAHQREVDELRECLEQAYGDKIGTYTMKGNEIERWRKALKGAKDESK